MNARKACELSTTTGYNCRTNCSPPNVRRALFRARRESRGQGWPVDYDGFRSPGILEWLDNQSENDPWSWKKNPAVCKPPRSKSILASSMCEIIIGLSDGRIPGVTLAPPVRMRNPCWFKPQTGWSGGAYIMQLKYQHHDHQEVISAGWLEKKKRRPRVRLYEYLDPCDWNMGIIF